MGVGSRGVIQFGFSPSPGRQPLPTFEQLAMSQLDSLYNFAYWLEQNRDNAADLVQETYLKALRGFPSFQPGTNFRAWMFQILKNTFLDSCSEAKRANTIPLDSEESLPLLPTNSNNAESILPDRSRSELLRHAIEELPISFREVILLRDVEDASYGEISQILSVPISTVMSRLARARQALRESLSSCSCEGTQNHVPTGAART